MNAVRVIILESPPFSLIGKDHHKYQIYMKIVHLHLRPCFWKVYQAQLPSLLSIDLSYSRLNLFSFE